MKKSGDGALIPSCVSALVVSDDRCWQVAGLPGDGLLVASAVRMFHVVANQIRGEYAWSEFSYCRWDEVASSLEFGFQESGSNLEFELVEPPTFQFMDLIREGIASHQLFWESVQLPSGAQIVCRVVRDKERNFRFFPKLQDLSNPEDQVFLSKKWDEWKVKLGLETE